MRGVEDLAAELARAVLSRRGRWTEAALAAHLAGRLGSDRREVIRECCRAACEDCRTADPQRVDEGGGAYYVHKAPGMDLLIECRSGDIRAALLEG
jgi:hypothetical protein